MLFGKRRKLLIRNPVAQISYSHSFYNIPLTPFDKGEKICIIQYPVSSIQHPVKRLSF